MTTREQLADAINALPNHRLGVMLKVAKALQKEVNYVSPKVISDIVSPAFIEAFSVGFLLYSVTHTQSLSKKAFEYLFQTASEADGKTALITLNPVEAASDITVSAVRYSLKTESSASISRTCISISKLMEASWMNEFKSKEDVLASVKTHILPHLHRYERLLCLRVFEYIKYTQYDLVELNLPALRTVADLKLENFSTRTVKGTTYAKIFDVENGKQAFKLGFDGTAKKIYIDKFRVDLCTHHGSWLVPTI